MDASEKGAGDIIPKDDGVESSTAAPSLAKVEGQGIPIDGPVVVDGDISSTADGVDNDDAGTAMKENHESTTPLALKDAVVAPSNNTMDGDGGSSTKSSTFGEADQAAVEQLTECKTLLLDLLNHRDAWPFEAPVDPVALGIPSYPEIIKHPMDLGTINKKLNDGAYQSVSQLKSDVDLVWSNCRTFNGPRHYITGFANKLQRLFDGRLEVILNPPAHGTSRRSRRSTAAKSSVKRGKYYEDSDSEEDWDSEDVIEQEVVQETFVEEELVEVEKILGSRIVGTTVQDAELFACGADPMSEEREYLVKWKETGYIHAEWVPTSAILEEGPKGRGKLTRFWKKIRNNGCTNEYALAGDGNAFPSFWKDVDRVISVRVVALEDSSEEGSSEDSEMTADHSEDEASADGPSANIPQMDGSGDDPTPSTTSSHSQSEGATAPPPSPAISTPDRASSQSSIHLSITPPRPPATNGESSKGRDAVLSAASTESGAEESSAASKQEAKDESDAMDVELPEDVPSSRDDGKQVVNIQTESSPSHISGGGSPPATDHPEGITAPVPSSSSYENPSSAGAIHSGVEGDGGLDTSQGGESAAKPPIVVTPTASAANVPPPGSTFIPPSASTFVPPPPACSALGIYGNTPGPELAGQKTQKLYLVKWVGLGYTEATWEKAEDVLEWNKRAVKEFERFNTPPRSSHVPSRPHANSWKPITKSPPHLGEGNTLRPYQLEGLNWLVFNWYHQRGSILADEMGLGKTIQSISFLAHLQKVEGIYGPFLVVVPLSTLGNWYNEFREWTDMNVVVFQGNAANRSTIREYEWHYRDEHGGVYLPKRYKFNAVLTTYEMILRSDWQDLGRIPWQAIVVDEAHRLKSRASKLLGNLQQFSVAHRLILTGTPLQNNTEELWTLLNFIAPRQFNSAELFLHYYGKLETSEQVTNLHTLLRPFLLRRLKHDVETSIPPKEEILVEVELTRLQKQYYRAMLERNRDFLNSGCKSNNVPNLINVVMQLRKVCNHPYLIPGAEDKDTAGLEDTPELYYKKFISAAGKMVLLDKLLTKLKAQGHRVLVFSQMVRVLDLLETFLVYRGHRYERLDGSIRGNARQAAIDRYNAPKSDRFVFLLCTRAGGLGINLTAADTVVIYDSDWNPQNDVQAQARCHRIGQTKEVKVYRLICRNTYERHMFERTSKKLGVDKAILDNMSGKALKQKAAQAKEIDSLLKYGAYQLFNETEDAPPQEGLKEEDIDSLLERTSTTIKYDQNAPKEKSTFSTVSFSSDRADVDIDMNADNFWELVLPAAKNAANLIKRLHEDEDLQTGEPTKLEEFWTDLSSVCSDAIQAWENVQDIPDMELIISLVEEVIHTYTELISEDRRPQVQKWLKLLMRSRSKKATRRRRRSGYDADDHVHDLDDDDDEDVEEEQPTRRSRRRHVEAKPKPWTMVERKRVQESIFALGRPCWNYLQTVQGLTRRSENDIRTFAYSFLLRVIQCSPQENRQVYEDLLDHVLDLDSNGDEDLKQAYENEADPVMFPVLMDKAYANNIKNSQGGWLKRCDMLRRLYAQIGVRDDGGVGIEIPEITRKQELPATWWGDQEDVDLLVGSYRHGIGDYERLFQDPELCFSKRWEELTIFVPVPRVEDIPGRTRKRRKSAGGVTLVHRSHTYNLKRWPARRTLNQRIKLLLEALEKHEMREERQRAKEEKKRLEQEEKDKERMMRWTKRERNELRAALMYYGPHDWEELSRRAKLMKTPDVVEAYAQELLGFCKQLVEQFPDPYVGLKKARAIRRRKIADEALSAKLAEENTAPSPTTTPLSGVVEKDDSGVEKDDGSSPMAISTNKEEEEEEEEPGEEGGKKPDDSTSMPETPSPVRKSGNAKKAVQGKLDAFVSRGTKRKHDESKPPSTQAESGESAPPATEEQSPKPTPPKATTDVASIQMVRQEDNVYMVSPIIAHRMLARIEFWKLLREKALKDEAVALENLKKASPGKMPNWWVPVEHDLALLKAIAENGFMCSQNSSYWDSWLESDDCAIYSSGKKPKTSVSKSQKAKFVKKLAEDRTSTLDRLNHLLHVILYPEEYIMDEHGNISVRGSGYSRRYITSGRDRRKRRGGDYELKMLPMGKRTTRRVERTEDGLPVLPMKVKGSTVHSLGTIVWDRANFHARNYLWPVGYTSTRELGSFVKRGETVTYTSEICDNGGSGPVFRVTAADAPDKPFEYTTSSGVWAAVLRKIKQKQNISVSGPEMFAFSDSTVKMLIQELPNADKCERYQFVDFVEDPFSIGSGSRRRSILNLQAEFGSEDEADAVSNKKKRRKKDKSKRGSRRDKKKRRKKRDGESSEKKRERRGKRRRVHPKEEEEDDEEEDREERKEGEDEEGGVDGDAAGEQVVDHHPDDDGAIKDEEDESDMTQSEEEHSEMMMMEEEKGRPEDEEGLGGGEDAVKEEHGEMEQLQEAISDLEARMSGASRSSAKLMKTKMKALQARVKELQEEANGSDREDEEMDVVA